LGQTYWKEQWPKPDKNNPTTFDPGLFWKHGGSLFFGNDWSAEIAVGCYNPTSKLCCHCNVQLGTMDDTDIRQLALFYLTLEHMCKEIKEMEHHQFLTNFSPFWKSTTEFGTKNSWQHAVALMPVTSRCGLLELACSMALYVLHVLPYFMLS